MLQPLPILKTLSIQSLAQYGLFHMHHQFNINGNTGVTYYDLSGTLTSVFREASALRRMHIRFYVDGYPRLLPLAQLTHATIDDLDVWQFSQLLRNASNLVYCRVVLRADSFANPNRTYQTSPPGLLRLPHLQTLVMLDNPEWHAIGLERYTGPLVLPSLKSLRLSWLHLDGDWPLESLVRLLERSQCELQQLTLNRSRGDSQGMLQPYRDALPQVQSIVLADGQSADDSHIFSDGAEDDYESDDTLGGLPEDEDEDL
uniref:F-box domain-containing protein n=1 Tax=Mycena chlorophos TaxID=658473 RepID=A0ABQ0LHJ5_MYCCL|nr:predicted protein [Mycena chlorophos]